MLSSYRLHLLGGFVLLSICLPSFVSAATGKGSVSLYSDSGCNQFDDDFATSQPIIIAENYTIEADTCGVLPRNAHSYLVTQHPTCSNGGQGYFTYFTSKDCVTKRPLPAAEATDTANDDKTTGVCLSLVDIASLAFVCAGKPSSAKTFNKDGTSTNTPSSPTTTTTSTNPSSSSSSSSSSPPTTGSISLFTDSGCNEFDDDFSTTSQPPTITLNHTSPADKCYTLPRSAHSYRIDHRPTCANGTIAGFGYYHGDNCLVTGDLGSAFNAVDSCDNGYDCTANDGQCLALVEFKSIAFVCDGVRESDGTESSSPSNTNTFIRDSTSTSVVLDPVATIAPSISSIATSSPPFYTYANGSLATNTQPASTVPSQTGGLAAPSPFTGGGVASTSVTKDSLISVLIAFAFSIFI
ncbi:MAG: hypothetical protein Q9186_006125 [Xanthomendoza sp. 1 TL-2023]